MSVTYLKILYTRIRTVIKWFVKYEATGLVATVKLKLEKFTIILILKPVLTLHLKHPLAL